MHEAIEAICMEKLLEMAWRGGGGRVLGNHQSGANSVNLVDGDSVVLPSC